MAKIIMFARASLFVLFIAIVGAQVQQLTLNGKMNLFFRKYVGELVYNSEFTYLF